MATDPKKRASAPPEAEPIADVNAVSVFLLWARDHGFAFDTLTIGRVQITAVRDYRPADQDQVRAAALADARAKAEAGQSLAAEFGMPPPPGAP